MRAVAFNRPNVSLFPPYTIPGSLTHHAYLPSSFDTRTLFPFKTSNWKTTTETTSASAEQPCAAGSVNGTTASWISEPPSWRCYDKYKQAFWVIGGTGQGLLCVWMARVIRPEQKILERIWCPFKNGLEAKWNMPWEKLKDCQGQDDGKHGANWTHFKCWIMCPGICFSKPFMKVY